MSGQTGSQASPCPDPEVVRGFGSEALNRPLQTYYLLFTRPYAEQMGAVSGVAQQPDMGSGVGQAKNCTRVRDQLRYLARIRGRCVMKIEIILQREIEECIERIAAALARYAGDGFSFRGLQRRAAAPRPCTRESFAIPSGCPGSEPQNGIASTFTRSQVTISRSCGRQGAIPTP